MSPSLVAMPFSVRSRNAVFPVELVVYPREGHGVSEYSHALDIEERIVRWLEKYL